MSIIITIIAGFYAISAIFANNYKIQDDYQNYIFDEFKNNKIA